MSRARIKYVCLPAAVAAARQITIIYSFYFLLFERQVKLKVNCFFCVCMRRRTLVDTYNNRALVYYYYYLFLFHIHILSRSTNFACDLISRFLGQIDNPQVQFKYNTNTHTHHR